MIDFSSISKVKETLGTQATLGTKVDPKVWTEMVLSFVFFLILFVAIVLKVFSFMNWLEDSRTYS